jgi:hypothetical protein
MTSTLAALETAHRQHRRGRWVPVVLFLLALATFIGAPMSAQVKTKVSLGQKDTAIITAKPVPPTVVIKHDTVTIVITHSDTVHIVQCFDQTLKPITCPLTPTPPIVIPPTPPSDSVPTQPIDTSGGLYPHQPAGFAPLQQIDFISANENGWTVADGSTPPRHTIASDPTAPVSPPLVGRQIFPAGMGEGGSPAIWQHGISGSHAVYFSYWIKLSANTKSLASGILKQMYLWSEGVGTVYTTAFNSKGDACYEFQVRTQGPGETKNMNPNLWPDLGWPCFTRGVWHQVEVLVQVDGGGTGVVDFWVDRVAFGHYTGVKVNNGGAFTNFQWSPVLGGQQGGTLTTEQDQDVDRIYISGKP